MVFQSPSDTRYTVPSLIDGIAVPMTRKAISTDQRRALRQWFQNQRPRPRQIDAARWFEKEFGHRITQATVSESLSKRFAYLDNLPDGASASAYRHRQAQWPILESILFEWYQCVERQDGHVTGDVLIQKAQEIWPQIPQYQAVPPPNFSAGWLSKFKKRHNIRESKRPREDSPLDERAEEDMRAIRTLCGEYPESDIFSVDETGLFWRQIPFSGRSNGPHPDESRIAIICCCNYTGTERLPLWLVGRAKSPRILRNINSSAMGYVWRGNPKAWTDGMIMAEWLQGFYRSLNPGRSVVLLMDNHSGHVEAIEHAPPPANVRIQWLPGTSTSQYQALEQGIIQSLKQHYRKYLLEFVVEQYEQQRDPQQEINLSHLVRWITTAWHSNISDGAIYRSFRKAKIQPQQQPISLPTDPLPNLSALWQSAQRLSHTRGTESLESFLSPDGEDAEPHDADAGHEELDLNRLIQRYTGQPAPGGAADADDLDGGDAPPPPPPPPSSYEALAAVRLLQSFSERQPTSTASDIRALERLERTIRSRMGEPG